MAATFDGINRIITLEAPVAGVLNQDVEQIYDDAKQWYLNLNNRFGAPFPFRTSGGDPLTPGISAGGYYQLQNQRNFGWRIRPSEEDHSAYFIGSLTPADAEEEIMIPTIGGFTVGIFGLQPITQNVSEVLIEAQNAAYNGNVVIDQAAGTAGTVYPIGTFSKPVSNISDAKLILDRVGGNKVSFQDSLLLDQDMEGFFIQGLEASLSDNLSLAGFSVDRSFVEGCIIDGVQGGTIAGFEAHRCGFQAMTSLSVNADNCIYFDNVSLKSGSTNVWTNCKSGVAGNSKVQVDATDALELQNRGWIGGFDLRGVNNALFAGSIDFHSGRLALQNTNTAGSLVLGGNFTKDTMDQAGMTVVDKGDARQMAEEPFEGLYTFEEMMRLVASEAAAKVIQQLDGSYAIRDLGDTKDRIIGDDAANSGRTTTINDVT